MTTTRRPPRDQTFTDASGNLVRCTVIAERLVVLAVTPQKRMAWPNLAASHARRLARILNRFVEHETPAKEPRPRPRKDRR